MFEFLVESYASRGVASAATVDELSRTADEVSRAGAPIRLVRAIPVPEEEICFYLFEARSVVAVREVASRAGLRHERICQVASTTQDLPARTAEAADRSLRATSTNQQGGGKP
jgi:hypothetical protein